MLKIDAGVRAFAGGLAHSGVRTVKFGSDRLWRHGLNAAARRAYVRCPPQLSAPAAEVAGRLDADGVAVSSLQALTGDPGLLAGLQDLAAELEQQHAGLVARRRGLLAGGGPSNVDKPFVVELLDRRRPVVEPDGLLARVALHPQLRGVADRYFGLRTRVVDVNVWRSLTTAGPATSSQLWHRDLQEDRFVLKMFIYLADVDAGGGPFSYLRRTHPKSERRALRLPGQTRGAAPRAPDDAPARLGLDADVLSLTGPAGTVIFADTLGFHRGGLARTSDRLLLQVLYASRAADAHRQLGLPAGISPRRYARDLAYDRR